MMREALEKFETETFNYDKQLTQSSFRGQVTKNNDNDDIMVDKNCII